MRRSYKLAIVLSLVGAIYGATAGWTAMRPKYVGHTLITVNSSIAVGTSEDTMGVQTAQWIASQAPIIQSTAIAEEATHDPRFVAAWKSAYGSRGLAVADFQNATHVEQVKTSNVIDVAFMDRSKSVAEAGTHAVVDAYLRLQSKTEDAQSQPQVKRTLDVLTAGDAVIPTDKRKIGGAVGFLIGGFLPAFLIMLYGLIDHHFRIGEDATTADLSGITVIGSLPYLTDQTTDLRQSATAAHCVHQIRTMLQVEHSNGEPQAVAITSSARGDGKTSLTMALGLSFAACGARTLLIDCDLASAGLTSRLNANQNDGVLEAVVNRTILEYVQTTDIADVAILPVGSTRAHHASTLSPVGIRRLILDAKRHFDVILIDTAPLHGSIEAGLICAAADCTVLTATRKQSRSLVERSIEMLKSINARTAGLVFNRARAVDLSSLPVAGNSRGGLSSAPESLKRAS